MGGLNLTSTLHRPPHRRLNTPSESAGFPSVVSVAWLAAALSAPRPGLPLRVVDVSWYHAPAQRDCHAEFLAEHIPTAVFYNLATGNEPLGPEISSPDEAASDASSSSASASPALTYMLPSAESFSRQMSALGIGLDTTVVVYDTAGILSSARLWWMLRSYGHERVAVLDGGLPQWQLEGHPIASGIPAKARPPG